MMVVSVLMSLVSLALPVVVVVLVVRQVGKRRGVGGPGDGGGVRRFFTYSLLYGLVVVSATGLADLLGRLLGAPVLESGAGALARSLTFAVLGPAFVVLLVVLIRRGARRDPDELTGLGPSAYLTLIGLTALVVAMVGWFQVVSSALSGDWPDGADVGALVVWLAVWAVHWWLGGRVRVARAVHDLLGALIGLLTSITGLIWLLGTAVSTLLVDPTATVDSTTVLGGSPELTSAGALLATGLPVWWVYWSRRLARQGGTPVWLGYVLPVGVGGSLVLAIGGATSTLYQVLVWFLGEPRSTQAAEHFANTPVAAAVVVVGWVSWVYHRAVLATAGADAAGPRPEAARVHDYLRSGIALVAAGAGAATVVVALLEALSPPVTVESGLSVTNTLIAAVTLLAVGGPLWWVFWRGVQQVVATDPGAELGSPTRRTYLFVLFGVGGVIAVVSVLVAAATVLEQVLDGDLGRATLWDVRIPLGLLLAAGAVSAYHWAVHRQDRAHAPRTVRTGPREVLLVGPIDEAVLTAVRTATGASVEHWVRSGVSWEVDQVLGALADVHGEVVAVVATASGPEAFVVEGRRRT